MRGLVGEARRGARVLDPQKQEWAGSGDDYVRAFVGVFCLLSFVLIGPWCTELRSQQAL